MSLVNDMLRDLDQRRKGSDGGAAQIPLTPAPEQYKEPVKQPVWLYLGIALLVAGGAIAYFWLQQSESASVRSLNIRTPVVVQPPVDFPDDEETVAEALEVSSAEKSEQSGNVVDASDTGAPGSAIAPEGRVEVALAESPAEENAGLVNPIASETSADETIEVARVAAQEPGVLMPEAMQTETGTNAIAENETAMPGADDPVIAAIETTGESAVVDLSEGPIESVKNTARLTPEEQDMIAVQEALGFIAQDNTTAAYARLEQELLNNRYAHQSRETYAKLLMSRGDAYSAMELTNSGLELAPNHSGYKKVKARLLMAAGEIEAATDLLIRRAPPITEDIEYHDILATAQLAVRDYEGALISYTSLVQQDRSQGKWWYGFAASQDFLGNKPAARQAYSQAMQLSNLSPNLRRRSQERLTSLSQ